LAQTDLLWALFGWRGDIDELFLIGEREIEELMQYIKSLELDIPQGKALDFGCGIGRLTQPLCRHFDQVYGVDIAPTMVELANKYNRYSNKCYYYLNENEGLGLFSDNNIDFIYSAVAFQNIAPFYSKKYIQEFLRILAPNGLIVFEIPGEPRSIRQVIKTMLPSILLDLYYKIKYRGRPRIELHGIKREEVIQFLEENGAKIIDVKRLQVPSAIRTFKDWTLFQYCVTKE